MNDPVYLDHNATTPVVPEVREAMWPYLETHFGNPSAGHVYGARAAAAVQTARRQVADLIGTAPETIIFTGCATEANNLALRGVAHALSGRRMHLITTAVEHPSVAEPFGRLRSEGWQVDVLAVDETGRVDPTELARVLRPDTALVSVMHANNEVGTIQPVDELSALARDAGALFHTDAAQSVGKLAVDMEALGADLLTVAGHKFGAPKGVGALAMRPGTPLEPLLAGGGQERGLRPGTENVPHIVGLGAAAERAHHHREADAARVTALRDQLHHALSRQIDGLCLNGHPTERLPGTLNISFPGVQGAALLAQCSGDVAASTGSACHSEEAGPSGVLGAMGVGSDRASGAVRLSVGLDTTPADVTRAADALVEAYLALL